LVALLSWQQRWLEVRDATRSRRALLYCFASGVAISVNWFFFIWAVNAGRVIETSLGYFMTPLVNVLFGATFLREKLTRWQLLSVLLALAGVLNLTLGYGRFPWLAITLCVSFGLYGLLRKQSGVRPIPGLFLETTLLTPIAAGYLIFLQRAGSSAFNSADWSMILLLISTGIVTGLRLVCFGHAARHLRLTTLGFLQYLSPSCECPAIGSTESRPTKLAATRLSYWQSMTDDDFQYAIENTRVILAPEKQIATFGSTSFRFYLISELMDQANEIRVRDGRIHA